MQEISSSKSLNSELYGLGELDDVISAEQGTTFNRRRSASRRVLRTSNGAVQRGLRRLRLLH